MGAKRADKRRMEELRMEVGVKGSFKKTFMRSSQKWAGHVGRMGDENQAKRADAQKGKTGMSRGDEREQR